MEPKGMALTDEFIRDADSQTRIDERTMQSTTALHSDIPAAKILHHHEYEPTERLVCPVCAWSGLAKEADTEPFEALFDVRCPECDKMLLIVSFPSASSSCVDCAAEFRRLASPK
jgi:hypothetical protein